MQKLAPGPDQTLLAYGLAGVGNKWGILNTSIPEHCFLNASIPELCFLNTQPCRTLLFTSPAHTQKQHSEAILQSRTISSMQEMNQHRNAACQQCHYVPPAQGIVLHHRTGPGKASAHFFCLRSSPSPPSSPSSLSREDPKHIAGTGTPRINNQFSSLSTNQKRSSLTSRIDKHRGLRGTSCT